MNKPRYMEELLAIIFGVLGSMFIVMGMLCFVGILKPAGGSSVQNPTALGVVFSLLGIGLCVAGVILKAIAAVRGKRHEKLLAEGIRIWGRVEKVQLQAYTSFGNQSPYRIYYAYTYQRKEFHGKSSLLWEKPDVVEGDSIEVYADEFGRSTIPMVLER